MGKGIVLGASGAGLGNSFLWRQILSDISGLPLFVYGEEEEERRGGGVVQYEKKEKKKKKGKKKDRGEATSLGTALLMQRDTHWKFAALGKIGKGENEEKEREEGMEGNK